MKRLYLFILIISVACLPLPGQAGTLHPTPTNLPAQVLAAEKPVRSATAAPLPTRAPATPSPTAGSETEFPIRAAFYYPWFPEAWSQQGMNPFTHYHPSQGFYDEDKQPILRRQIEEMQYGKIQAGIASWWGIGQPTDRRFANLLKLGEEMKFQWAIYAEAEGVGNPTVDSIRKDLEYIRDQYSASPAYLKIGGHFVVFVYAQPEDSCDMAARWKQANSVGAYVVLKVFPGFHNCPDQPDSWHQYAPANAVDQQGKYSFTISPGFWKGTEPKPRLERDVSRWEQNIRAMIASHADFQLVTTFNEWGEGTAVEDAQEWSSPSSYGAYLDALHFDGIVPGG